MDRKYVELVRDNGNGRYRVTANGVTKTRRLFYEPSRDIVCEFKAGSHTYGYPLTDAESIHLMGVKNEDADYKNVKKARKYAAKVHRLLQESGLWSQLSESFRRISLLTDDQLHELVTTEYSDEYLRSLGIEGFGTCSSFKDMMDYGVQQIRYRDDFQRDMESANFQKALTEGSTFTTFWHNKKMDYRLNIGKNKNGEFCATYSEEYEGTGNGHYYLAVNGTHAIFAEDD